MQTTLKNINLRQNKSNAQAVSRQAAEVDSGRKTAMARTIGRRRKIVTVTSKREILWKLEHFLLCTFRSKNLTLYSNLST
jgi:hypothetical protein